MNASHGGAGHKEGLRREMKERLASMDPQAAQRAAEDATSRLLKIPEVERARNVFTCLSFGDEIDTSGLIATLLNRGGSVYVPRSELATWQLHLHEYPCRLQTLSFGLSQPLADQPELAAEAIDETIDVAVIVGLAFDPRGFRLGYGQGFFDRFLVDRPFPTVGLAYDLQVAEQIPNDHHDVPLSVITTERRTLRSQIRDR